MITSADLIRLPYTPDLTQAGTAYACRSLAYTYNRMGGSPGERMRRIAGGKAVELAFRRWVAAQGIPFDTLGTTPFTDPDHYDISIGGRRVDVKSFLITQREQIRQVHRSRACLLEASALVPQDQLSGDHFDDEDLYIFAFLTGLVTHGPEDLQRAVQAGQPVDMVAVCPPAWAQPGAAPATASGRPWGSLGRLVLKLEAGAQPANQPLHVELGGQALDRSFQSEVLQLTPGQRLAAEKEYASLIYLRLAHPPVTRLAVHTPALNDMLVLQPNEWHNIWVYGMRIYLVGYATRGEMRRQAELLPAGSSVWQYAHTRTPNYALPMPRLRPIHHLVRSAKEWK